MKWTLNRTLLALFLLLPCAGMGMNGGCQNCADLTGLDGIWTITRGDIEVRITFTAASGGEQETTKTQTTLEPLDPNEFPAELAEFVALWNNNLAEVQKGLDDALPSEVIVTFPNECVTMRLTDPNDPSMVANGLIGQQLNYLFGGPVAGSGGTNEQGTAVALALATVEGNINRTALTTSGEIVRRLAVFVGNADAGLSFVVALAVNYTGERTGDVP